MVKNKEKIRGLYHIRNLLKLLRTATGTLYFYFLTFALLNRYIIFKITILHIEETFIYYPNNFSVHTQILLKFQYLRDSNLVLRSQTYSNLYYMTYDLSGEWLYVEISILNNSSS